jgi:hypothetical protein
MDRGIGKRMRFRLFFVRVWEIYNRVEIPELPTSMILSGWDKIVYSLQKSS